MIITIRESAAINRTKLQMGDFECAKRLRYQLKKRGMDVRRRLTLDLNTPGSMRFTYYSDVHSAYAFPFAFYPLSAEQKYRHNLKQAKTKGKDGTFVK